MKNRREKVTVNYENIERAEDPNHGSSVSQNLDTRNNGDFIIDRIRTLI